MDKLLHRRGAKKSSASGFGGDSVVIVEKSKKDRIRKLSSIGKTSSSLFRECEMGCDVSDGEDEHHPSKKLKLPRKFLDDCNGLQHASVPRKLRSAMKKRHRESASLSLQDSNGVKKPNLKQGDSDRSHKTTISEPITKDELEVVESLYALAGLVFPNNEASDNTKLDSVTLDANASALPESKNSCTPAVEVEDIKMDSIFPCTATNNTSPTILEGLARGTYQVDVVKELNPQQHFLHSGKICIDSDNKAPQNQINISSLPSKVEQCNEKPFGNALNFVVPSQSSLDSRRLNQTVKQETSVFGRKPEIALELGMNNGSQVEPHVMIQESQKKALWPGLSTNIFHPARNDIPSLQFPAAKLPPWLDAALSTSKDLVQTGSSFAKVTKIVNGRKSCKKCAAHVYISHLIQSLKNSESKDKLMVQSYQMGRHERSKQGSLLGINSYKVENSLNGVVSGSSIGSTAEKPPNEAKNGVLQLKNLHQDQSTSTSASAYALPKQNFEFLSLSAGGSSLESKDSFSRGRNVMEQSSQAQDPYLHSLVQHHNFLPFSLHQSRYNSSAFPDNPTVAQQAQVQLSPYGYQFSVSQANHTALTKQPPQQQQLHLQQQQHQQQRLWAAQYRPAGSPAATVPFSSWQNVKQETSTLIQCGQALISPSPSTFELVSPKYAPLSQQYHQQLRAVTSSFPPGRLKRTENHLPSLYEESVGGFRATSTLPLQLLCNERL